MKRAVRLCLISIALFTTCIAFAGDIPRVLTHQGYLTDKGGNPVNKTVSLSVGIYKGLAGEDLLFEEDLGNVEVRDGFYHAEIGAKGGLDAVFSSNAEVFLEIRIDGGKLSPRQKAGAVPYSFVSLDAVGDIHPKSVTVGTTPVIDAAGKWVGDRSDIGTVKSVGAAAPLSGGPITDTGTISLPKADGTTSGYLSSTDWMTFNDKQSRVTGVCNPGTCAVSVNVDGTVNCIPCSAGTGTVTSVGTGPGLTGGPVTTAGTIGLDSPYLDGSAYDSRFIDEGQTASVTSGMIVDGTVAFADIGDCGCTANQIMQRNTINTSWQCSNAAVPSGMIAIFDAACPPGWTLFAALDGRVPRGAASYGGTGGSDSHVHAVSPPFTETGSVGDHTHSQRCGGGITSGGGGTQPAECGWETGGAGWHYHGVDIPQFTSGAQGSWPPYLAVIFCKKG